MTSTVSIGVTAAIGQSLIFIVYDLVAKRLRERGFGAIELSQTLRWALFPALVVLVFSWDNSAAATLLANPAPLWTLFGFVGTALVFQFVYFRCLHITHSLAVASVTRNAIGLPMLMLIGIFVNHDQPTIWGVCGLVLMICASFLRPGRTHLDHTQFLASAKTVFGLSLSFVCLVTIKDPLYRLWLQQSHSVVMGVAIYMVLFSTGLWIYFALRPIQAVVAKTQTSSRTPNDSLLMISIPVVWVLGTIPEGVAFGMLPVYSMIAIGTVSWIVTIAADIHYKRLAPTPQTAAFAFLVLSSILLSLVDRGVLRT